jgi:hypothetical protein
MDIVECRFWQEKYIISLKFIPCIRENMKELLKICESMRVLRDEEIVLYERLEVIYNSSR